MKPIQQMIEVRVPVHTAYEKLSSFECYPQFMTGVQEVRQVSESTTHWVMDLDGRRTEFDAQITDCTLDERVAWKATGSTKLAEAITLKPVSADRTQITAELEADARALLPSDAHAQESLSRRLKADLDGFKRFVEQGNLSAGDLAAGGGASTKSATRSASAKSGARAGAAKSASNTGNLPSPAVMDKNAKTRQGSADVLRGSASQSGNLAVEPALAADDNDLDIPGESGTRGGSRRRGGGGRA